MNKVFIYCDGHPGRRVPVAEFVRRNAGLLGGWLWDEQPVVRGQYTATSIVNDKPENPGWALDPDNHQRIRHVLRCSRCGVDVIVKHERLVELLDTFGEGDVTLDLVATRLRSS